MPPWVQEGGLDAWVKRLQDPKIRAQVIQEMRTPTSKWENLYLMAGAEGTKLIGFKTDKLKPLTGKTLAEVAKKRGTSAEDTIIDLIIEDHSRIDVVYFLMSEDNVRLGLKQPWVSLGSDAEASAPELVPFLAVSFFTGIRRSEALRLDWSAIDLHENFVKLPGAIDGNTSGRVASNRSGITRSAYTW